MLGQVAPFPRDRFLKFCKRLKVLTKDFGLVPFEMIGTQTYILDELCAGLEEGITTFVFLKARQLGCTTFFLALDLFWAFEYKGLAGAFATHTEQSRDDFRNIVEVFLTNLPPGFKRRHTKHNKTHLLFVNNSAFAYLVAGTKQKTKSSLGRSGARNYLHATEVAFWGSEEDLKELRATMSAHYPHRLQVYESTANGFNHYQEMWEQAVTSPTQRAVFIGWWRHDHYRYPLEHPFFRHYMPSGEATAFTPLERKRAAAVKKEYGFTITAEQIAWYRWKLEEECDGDQMKMDEMFPWMPEDAFVATGSKFFTNDSLTDAMRYARSQAYVPFRYHLTKDWAETACIQVPPAAKARAELKIWEAADPVGHYALGCDPAYGSSDEADRTVISIHRCFADRCYQVAEFCTPSVSTYQCAWVLAHLAGYYRNIMVNLEITGPGNTVLQELDMLRRHADRMIAAMMAGQVDASGKKLDDTNIRNCLANMRYYVYKRPDNMNGNGMLQWKMSGENKFALLTKFKDAIELKRCWIRSLPALEECKAVVMEDGQIHAQGRAKDDRVIANALAHEAWRQWVQPKLMAQGLTFQRAVDMAASGGAQQLREMALNYLRSQKIAVPAEGASQ